MNVPPPDQNFAIAKSCWQSGEKWKALLKWIMEMLKLEGEVKSADGWAFSGLALSFSCFFFLVSWLLELENICATWPLPVILQELPTVFPAYRISPTALCFSELFSGGCRWLPKNRSGCPNPARQHQLRRQCLIRTLVPVCTADGKQIPSSAACDWQRMAQGMTDASRGIPCPWLLVLKCACIDQVWSCFGGSGRNRFWVPSFPVCTWGLMTSRAVSRTKRRGSS